MYKRVDTLLNASNISVNAGTDRVFVEENMRFYLPVFSNTLSTDTSKVVPALASNWWWVWAPLAEQRKGWDYAVREANDIDVMWNVETNKTLVVNAIKDTTVKMNGYPGQGDWYYLALVADPVTPVTITLEAGKFKNAEGVLTNAVAVVPGQNQLIALIGVGGAVLQGPKHL